MMRVGDPAADEARAGRRAASLDDVPDGPADHRIPARVGGDRPGPDGMLRLDPQSQTLRSFMAATISASGRAKRGDSRPTPSHDHRDLHRRGAPRGVRSAAGVHPERGSASRRGAQEGDRRPEREPLYRQPDPLLVDSR